MGTRERASGTAQAQAALVGGRGGNQGSGVVVRPAEMEKQTLALYRAEEHTGEMLFAATYSIKRYRSRRVLRYVVEGSSATFRTQETSLFRKCIPLSVR